MASLKIMIDRCTLSCSLYVAPATKGSVQLDYTIPDLLDMGCAYRYTPALHQWSPHGWESWSYHAFRLAAEELALGLLAQELPGEARNHVGLLLDSDIYWALADMGSLLAGLVTVPIDAGQTLELIRWIVSDANLSVLIVSNWRSLRRLYGVLQSVRLIVVVDESPTPAWVLSAMGGHVIKTLREIRRQGRLQHSPTAIQALKDAIHTDDLATIVYTADAQGNPKGAMLSHKNLTGNILAAFSSMPGLIPGTRDVALSFLPLNHIFARAFLYGHFGFGHDVYFSTPQRVFRHLATVKPTIFITVPRLLEKVYERINSLRQQSFGLKRHWLNWGWSLAHRYPLSDQHLFWRRLHGWILRYGMFGSLRQAFGGNIRYLLCGGAALQSEIMTFFNRVGIPVKQGYGLTETSSVLSYTRDLRLRSGTVGTPIPGVVMRLASDGEILVKSPYTMVGYYHNSAATDAVIDSDGWFHTGDLGEFSEDGLLTLRGCKKRLFKLSTGKYVAPGPIEEQLESSPLVKQAVLVGPGQKFCGVLIVPEIDALKASLPSVRSQYQRLIDQINKHLPHWSTIKRFALVEAHAEGSPEQLYQGYAREIKTLYQEAEPPMRQVQPKRFSRLLSPRLPLTLPFSFPVPLLKGDPS